MNTNQTVRPSATLHFDGSCWPSNPDGWTAGGFVLTLPDGRKVEGGEVLRRPGEKGTNNIAEFFGLILGLKSALAAGVSRLHVYGDSQLAVFIMTGKWRAHKHHLRSLRDEALALVRQFQSVQFHWIRRAANEDADGMAMRAIQLERGQDPDEARVHELDEALNRMQYHHRIFDPEVWRVP